jgi:hypothetical protein
MKQLRAALARIAGFFTGHRADHDLQDELQSHLDMEIRHPGAADRGGGNRSGADAGGAGGGRINLVWGFEAVAAGCFRWRSWNHLSGSRTEESLTQLARRDRKWGPPGRS